MTVFRGCIMPDTGSDCTTLDPSIGVCTGLNNVPAIGSTPIEFHTGSWGFGVVDIREGIIGGGSAVKAAIIIMPYRLDVFVTSGVVNVLSINDVFVIKYPTLRISKFMQ